jgi:hypothetical protein
MEKPSAIPAHLTEHLRLMYALLRVAFQSDSTRIATLMVGREGSLRSYGEIGAPESHHPITHHQGRAGLIEKVARINRHHIQLFSEFVASLAQTPDGDGSLLHLPTMLAGGARGVIKPERFVQAAPQTPISNLYVSMLGTMGAAVEKIGDSTGKLTGIGVF